MSSEYRTTFDFFKEATVSPQDKKGDENDLEQNPLLKKEKEKNHILEEIKQNLENLFIGTYTADKDYGGGYSQELFNEPTNLDGIMNEASEKIDKFNSGDLSQQQLVQELKKIKVFFNFDQYREDLNDFAPDFTPDGERRKLFDDFSPIFESMESLSTIINIEHLVAQLTS